MKILLVGSDFEYAIERYYKNYLKGFGCEVCHFTAPDIIFNAHSKNIINKVLFKTGLHTGYAAVNKELLRLAYAFNPDIIWIFKGLEIYPRTLETLRKDFKLANFNPDHPFIIIARANGNNNIRNSVGLYHLHFCYHSGLMKQIQHEFHIPTVFLPFAYDRTDMIYQMPEMIGEINRICFQANPDAYRVQKVQLLSNAGLKVDVYGHGWTKTSLATNKNVSIHGIASRPDFWKLNQQYRVQLNLFRAYNNDSHNMRTFEIPAVGGIQLTPWSEEQAGFFRENEEIFFFSSDNEMVNKAKQLLEMDKEQADRIRAAARKRSFESAYSFEDRATTVFKTFQKMMETW